MTTSDPLDEVRAATEARTEAHDSTDERWRAAIVAAASAGTPRTDLAKAAHISRARLYQILGEQP